MSHPIQAETSATVWKQRIEAWKETEQSQKEFCGVHDLAYHCFVYWRKKFDGDTARGKRVRRNRARVGGGFAAVVREAPTDAGLTLALPNGLILRGICATNVAVVRALLDQFR